MRAVHTAVCGNCLNYDLLDYHDLCEFQEERGLRFQLWTHENHEEHIFADRFVRQKLEYIHMNPVRAGIVRTPEDYNLLARQQLRWLRIGIGC